MPGKNILVFGDLHISDVHKGRHKSYLSNCSSIVSYVQSSV